MKQKHIETEVFGGFCSFLHVASLEGRVTKVVADHEFEFSG